MSREEVIRLAREAGLKVGTNISGVCLVGSPAEIGLAHLDVDELARFAALVAASERQACAAICEQLQDWPHDATPYDCAQAIRAGRPV